MSLYTIARPTENAGIGRAYRTTYAEWTYDCLLRAHDIAKRTGDQHGARLCRHRLIRLDNLMYEPEDEQ